MKRPSLSSIVCALQKFVHCQMVPPARVAFIVETVTTRISKAQKKFAILTVSDGVEQQELPIWPDLFEANSTLLRDNQLLYAIIQVDKAGDEVKLRCRWLADLTDLNDDVKQLATEALERAKSMGKKKKSGPHRNART